MRILLLSVLNSSGMSMMEEIGICYIAAYLREKGHYVMLRETWEENVNYDEIVDFMPEIVGLPVYSISKANVYRVIAQIRKMLDGAVICVGGILPTCSGEEMLEENHEIDFAIKGEGELVFEQLVGRIENLGSFEGIAGLVYRMGNTIIVNTGQQYIDDLDKLPFAARDIYLGMERSFAHISTIRGCKGRCTFCAYHLYHGKFRLRSAKNVVDEIEYLYKEHGIDFYTFTDGSFEDSIDDDVSRIRDIAVDIIKRDLRISYNVFMRADFYKKADGELMGILVKSGLCCALVGIEAGNEADLKLYNKLAAIDDNYNIIEFLRKNKTNFAIGFINFNPYSTFDTLEKNIDFLENVGLACYTHGLINKLTLYPGTSMYKRVKNDTGINIIDDNLDYAFPDLRLMTMHKYLNLCFFEYGEKYDNPHWRLSFYVSMFGIYLARAYKFASELHDDTMLAILGEILPEREKLISRANSYLAKWYRQLLKAVKTGFDESRGDEYYSTLLYTDEFLDMVDNMKAHMHKFIDYANKEENRYIYKGHYIMF